MKNSMNIKNEKGSVLIPALMIMVLLTIMGFSIAATTTMGLKVAVNKKYHKTAFSSAESGISYVMNQLTYYHEQNIEEDQGMNFPGDLADSQYPDNAEYIGNGQYFYGKVIYRGEGPVPPGFGTGMVKDDQEVSAYDYEINSVGFVKHSASGSTISKSEVKAQFYRIGYTKAYF